MQESDFDAIFVCGGDAPPFIFPNAIELQKKFVSFYEAGKPSATLCHGTSLLLYTKLSNNKDLIAGKKITGFSNAEELLVKQKTGTTISPIMIETEAKKLGAEFKTLAPFAPYALADGNLITGQQASSGKSTALLVIEQLLKDK
jgi:putative intracellular protease/amidase